MMITWNKKGDISDMIFIQRDTVEVRGTLGTLIKKLYRKLLIGQPCSRLDNKLVY